MAVTAQHNLYKTLMEEGQPTDTSRQWTEREAGLSCIIGDSVTAQLSLHKILMEEEQPTDISRQWIEREPGLSCITGDTDSHSPAQPSQDSDGGWAAS